MDMIVPFTVLGVGAGGLYAMAALGLVLIHRASAVSYTHLRAHETVLDLVCRLLLEKKKKTNTAHRHRPTLRYQ